jgi:hypothetical protein
MSYGEFQNSRSPWGTSGGIFPLVVQAWAYSVEIFLNRTDCGSRYVAVQAPTALFLMPIYCLFCDLSGAQWMMVYLLAYLGRSVIVRVRGIASRFESRTCHSRYVGTPRLMSVLRWSEVTIKHHIEPALVIVVSVAMFWASPTVGFYLLIAGSCLYITVSEAQRHVELRAADMNDAVIEQEIVAERFGEIRGE